MYLINNRASQTGEERYAITQKFGRNIDVNTHHNQAVLFGSRNIIRKAIILSFLILSFGHLLRKKVSKKGG